MTIFHMAHDADWRAAQVERSAAKHRAGQRDLVLLWVDAEALGASLRWERSGSGGVFPHLYGALPMAAVHRTDPLPVGDDGRHRFPALETT
jgi:uncharacterized protein (DUF952 family)